MSDSSYADALKKRLWRRLIVATMAAAALFAHSCSDITTSTLLCEDAASRIFECCSAHPAVSCHENGCADQRPNFSQATAKCIRSSSCDALRQAGICDVTDWHMPSYASCIDGQAICQNDGGVCPASVAPACAALGRLTCS
ncbi:MAG TPA: hypothetical protein PKL17_13405 [Pseudomonadota bacterium]|nr:hypothetical protein [Pseudomonadota bacterium]HNI60677.1 hypothetical protein [Pseudomonadota bacterium]HNK45778.1 hypothetical protein [Pseudomonadota bacterium]HNN52872.1 hypothetical protein [Pseudomonadota bacterium]